MGPAPTIPTSFVPKQPVRAAQTYARTGGNIFMLIGVILFVLSLVGAVGVFVYERFLDGSRNAKAAALAQAEGDVNTETIEEFIRNRDRFTAAHQILDDHITSSRFFESLERLTIPSVRFENLSFTLVGDRSAEIVMEGVARNFNALAVQSAAIAEEKQIKRVIFSNITVAENGTVEFSLSADIDPRLLEMTLDAVPVPVAPTATTTPAATSTAPVGTTTAPQL